MAKRPTQDLIFAVCNKHQVRANMTDADDTSQSILLLKNISQPLI